MQYRNTPEQAISCAGREPSRKCGANTRKTESERGSIRKHMTGTKRDFAGVQRNRHHFQIRSARCKTVSAEPALADEVRISVGNPRLSAYRGSGHMLTGGGCSFPFSVWCMVLRESLRRAVLLPHETHRADLFFKCKRLHGKQTCSWATQET